MRPYHTDLVALRRSPKTKGLGYHNVLLLLSADAFIFGWFILQTLEDLLTDFLEHRVWELNSSNYFPLLGFMVRKDNNFHLFS